MQIPIPNILRHWREEELRRGLAPVAMRRGIGIWAFFAKRPALYRLATRIGARLLRNFAGGKGRLARVPLAPPVLTHGWTDMRDLPAPSGKTFHALYRQRKGVGR